MSPQGQEYVNSLSDSFQSMSSRSTSSYEPPPVIIIILYYYSALLLFFFLSVFGRETNNGLCFDVYKIHTLCTLCGCLMPRKGLRKERKALIFESRAVGMISLKS